MTAQDDAVQAVLTALSTVDGLRPSTPASVPTASWLPWQWDTLAVDVTQDVVRVQVVASRLPLPKLLRRADEAIRPALRSTPWALALVRLVVTDVDRSAFQRDSPHPNGA